MFPITGPTMVVGNRQDKYVVTNQRVNNPIREASDADDVTTVASVRSIFGLRISAWMNEDVVNQ
jgi:hypothetical protein